LRLNTKNVTQVSTENVFKVLQKKKYDNDEKHEKVTINVRGKTPFHFDEGK
jgi:hypothetical protein